MKEKDLIITNKHIEISLFLPPLIPFKEAQLTLVTNLLKPLSCMKIKMCNVQCAMSVVKTCSSECRERWFDLQTGYTNLSINTDLINSNETGAARKIRTSVYTCGGRIDVDWASYLTHSTVPP